MLESLRSLRHMARIVRVLAKHDALTPVRLLKMPLLSFAAAMISRKPRRKKSEGKRLAAAFEELGPTFIKLGQALSLRADLIGEETAQDLASLRNELPPFSGRTAREIVEKELEKSLAEVFSEFEETAVAAASIAQVHKAVTPDGRVVAVKILRPDIEKMFERDLELFFWIASRIERRNPAYKRFKPVEVVATFAETVRMEIDMRMEAAAASELAENFRGRKGFRVPEVDWSRTSGRILTSEWIEGVQIDNREALVSAGHDPDIILKNAADCFFRQIFEDGFFHADIHPGNIFIDAAGDLVPVDFGIMGRMDMDSRVYIAEIMAGFLNRDYKAVAKAHFRAGYVPAGKSVENFTQACRSVGEPIMGLPLNEISVARLLMQMFKVAKNFEMEVQPRLLLLQKTLMMAEGLGRILNPQLNMWKLAEPVIKEWVEKNMSLRARAKHGLAEVLDLLKALPDIVKRCKF